MKCPVPSSKRRFVLLSHLLGWLPAWARKPLPPEAIDAAADALARQIADDRQQAIAGGVRPMPPGVYRGLLGYFPASLLDRCRYTVSRTHPYRVPGPAAIYGGSDAMTLGEIVLFRDDAAARSDLQAWAHQLTHVMQYQRWGLDEFADRYVRDKASLEKEANENVSRFVSWRQHA